MASDAPPQLVCAAGGQQLWARWRPRERAFHVYDRRGELVGAALDLIGARRLAREQTRTET